MIILIQTDKIEKEKKVAGSKREEKLKKALGEANEKVKALESEKQKLQEENKNF